MIRPSDLLQHALSLSERPDEVAVRRAVAAAYYALFHTLTHDSAAFFDQAGPELAAQVVRAFEHRTMRRVCERYVRRGPFGGDGGPGLGLIANIFIELQDMRHDADYDLSTDFDLIEGRRLVERAATAILAWTEIGPTQERQAFLATLLLGDRFRRG